MAPTISDYQTLATITPAGPGAGRGLAVLWPRWPLPGWPQADPAPLPVPGRTHGGLPSVAGL